MVTLVSLEAAESQNSAILSAKLKRHFSGKHGARAHILDVRDDPCVYTRTLRILDALRSVPPGAEIVFCPIAFYRFSGDKAVWLEFSNRLAEASSLRTTIDLHVMLFARDDPHELLDEFLGRGVSSHGFGSLEEARDFVFDSTKTAKKPLGHPFAFVSYVFDLPRFGADTPALLDAVCDRMVFAVAKSAARR
jgi:hypothetical protein